MFGNSGLVECLDCSCSCCILTLNLLVCIPFFMHLYLMNEKEKCLVMKRKMISAR